MACLACNPPNVFLDHDAEASGQFTWIFFQVPREFDSINFFFDAFPHFGFLQRSFLSFE